MPENWFSPYPVISRGSPGALDDLANLDKDLSYIESILADLKEKRRKARESANTGPVALIEGLHSEFLTIVENQRRAESELSRLREERLKLVLLADLAYDPPNRGEYFPYPNVEEKAQEFIQKQKDRLLAVSTVAFFGSGITFSTIFSGSRGSIGLMGFSWAAFTFSFSVCVFTQWLNPEKPPFAVVTYPRRRRVLFSAIYFAGFASFVGMVLMGASVATLNLAQEGSASQVDTRINTTWGGIFSLIPVILGFSYGITNTIFHSIKAGRIKAQRYRLIKP
ncbi:hypothetical protein BYT27DRAFT_7249308 [Phlegmacium glaucopus]|nr:hypothetical protein BYT27DRAFT_7249308 [Phlegmacium glaucopus]